jgi:hypothetical protein
MAELGFYDWTQAVIKAIRKNRIVAGRNITLEEHEDKTIIHSNYIFGGAGGGYDGPFAVVKETDTTIKVLGKNISNGRNFENEIYLGVTKIIKPEFTLTVSSSGFVTIYISYSGSSYNVGHYFTTSITPTNGTIYVPLAWVDFSDGKISKITQFQYGQINFPARLL